MAFAHKCGQNISSSEGGTESRAFAPKCGQNCANLLCRNNIYRALPENNKLLEHSFAHPKRIQFFAKKCYVVE